MKIRNLILATAVLLACTPFLAQGIPEDAPPELVLRLVLDLSDDQVTAIQELAQARASAIEPIVEEIHMLEPQLDEALRSEEPDPFAVGELVLAIRGLQHEIEAHQVEFREGFQSILTLEQMERVEHIIHIALANRAAEALKQLGLR